MIFDVDGLTSWLDFSILFIPEMRLFYQVLAETKDKSITQNYTWEKLFTTILILATGDGTVQERLIDAYSSSLMRLRPEDLPEGLQKEFAELQERLTSVEATNPGEGRIHATIKQMEPIEANKVVEQIISIYDRYRVNLIDDVKVLSASGKASWERACPFLQEK